MYGLMFRYLQMYVGLCTCRSLKSEGLCDLVNVILVDSYSKVRKNSKLSSPLDFFIFTRCCIHYQNKVFIRRAFWKMKKKRLSRLTRKAH